MQLPSLGISSSTFHGYYFFLCSRNHNEKPVSFLVDIRKTTHHLQQIRGLSWDTLWKFNIAIENDHLSVDLPIENGDFP